MFPTLSFGKILTRIFAGLFGSGAVEEMIPERLGFWLGELLGWVRDLQRRSQRLELPDVDMMTSLARILNGLSEAMGAPDKAPVVDVVTVRVPGAEAAQNVEPGQPSAA